MNLRTRTLIGIYLSVGVGVGCAESPVLEIDGDQIDPDFPIQSADASGDVRTSGDAQDEFWRSRQQADAGSVSVAARPGAMDERANAVDAALSPAADVNAANVNAANVNAGNDGAIGVVVAPASANASNPMPVAEAATAANSSTTSDASGTPVKTATPAASPPAPAAASAAAPAAPSVAATGGSNAALVARCAVPGEAQAEDVSRPTTVVGSGTAASCTSSAFVAAVAKGGVVTFNCGADPVTIKLEQTAKIFNDKSQKVIIDGGGKVTLSGDKKVRILYQNTCDEKQVFLSEHCDNQEFPQLTVQNLTFVDGNAKSDGEGGGAILAKGGRLKIVNSRFYGNVCPDVGPEVGGGAVRALMQFNGLPVHVVNSTFGEASRGNVCSNGGALSGVNASFNVLNSSFRENKAIGIGANPPKANTPGGGNGGAIYNDGNTFNLNVCGSTLEKNTANEGGGALFFVSNDRSGQMSIKDSTLQSNPSGQFETYPGIFVLARGEPAFTGSVVR